MQNKQMTYAQMIDNLHKNTVDGKLTLEYMDAAGDTYTKTYPMNWPEIKNKDWPELLEWIVQSFEDLKHGLEKIVLLSKSLRPTREENADILDEETLDIWDCYIRPFDPHNFDVDALKEMDDKLCLNEPLTDEERKLGAQFEAWRDAQARDRFFSTTSPLPLLIAANRYFKALELNAPEIIVNNELLELAKAYVVFFNAKDHESCFCCDTVHEGDICPHCGWKKRPMLDESDFDDLLAHQNSFFLEK